MALKVVVTGGAGFIGSHIVDELVGRYYDVHVIDDLSGGTRENVNKEATFHELDIRDREAITPVFDKAHYVFHTAALPRVQFSIDNPIDTHEVNVTGTLNVLNACVEGGIKKMVFSSSSSIYGEQDTMPLVENMEPAPKSPYGLHKYMGELYCQMWRQIYGLPTVCLRYFNVYGPRQSAEGAYALVIAKFLKQRSEGQQLTITGDGEQTRDFTHVNDVVHANLRSIESAHVGNGEVINIGAGNNISINRIAELVGGEATHIEPRYEPRNTLADNTKAMQLLNWTPEKKLEEAVEELKQLHGLE